MPRRLLRILFAPWLGITNGKHQALPGRPQHIVRCDRHCGYECKRLVYSNWVKDSVTLHLSPFVLRFGKWESGDGPAFRTGRNNSRDNGHYRKALFELAFIDVR